MRKLRHLSGIDKPLAPLPGFRPRLLWVVVALAAAPLVYEGGFVCYARWCGLFGRAPQVETPVSEWIVQIVGGAGRDASLAFEHARWDPSHVQVAAIVVCVGSMLLLKARGTR